jgi:hypothetical protein
VDNINTTPLLHSLCVNSCDDVSIILKYVFELLPMRNLLTTAERLTLPASALFVQHHARNKLCYVCNKPTNGVFNTAHEIVKKAKELREAESSK